MGGGRYFQEVAANLSSEKDIGDNSVETARSLGTSGEDSPTVTVKETQNNGKEDCKVLSVTSGTGMETKSYPGLETNSKKPLESVSSVDPNNVVQCNSGGWNKLLPKKRSRRPPVPLGEVKYPSREVLKYSSVIVGIRGTICKQDVDEEASSESLFEDVKLAWNAWKAVGVQVALVTNSMSFKQAKGLLGNELFSYVVQYFDEETVGPLDLPDAYIAMAKKLQSTPNKILFAGSVYEHVAAASEAGLQVAIVVRYDNPPLPRDVRYKMCTKLTHLIPASLLIDKGGYVSSEGSTTSC